LLQILVNPFIENKPGGICRDLKQCIARVSIVRGDFSMVGQFSSLNDRVKTIRRRAINR